MPAEPIAALCLNLIADHPDAFAFQRFQAITGCDVAPFSAQCTAEAITFPPDKYDAAVAFFESYKTTNNLKERIAHLRAEKDDIHAKLMRSYPEVPDWWYLSVFAVFLALMIVAQEVRLQHFP